MTASYAPPPAASAAPGALPSQTTAGMLIPLIPSIDFHVPLNDPVIVSSTNGSTFATAKGTPTASQPCYQIAGGVMSGAPSLLRGDSAATSTIFSKSGRPVIEFAASGLDSTGATAMGLSCVMRTMHARKGSTPYFEHLCGKRGTDAISAGYAIGVYWTGSKLVLATLWQGATQANYIFVCGYTDLLNGQAYHVALAKAGAKTAASCALFVNGQPEAMTVLSDTLGSDTCTNGGNFSIGGLGGGRTGTNDPSDTDTGFSGTMEDVLHYSATPSARLIASMSNAAAAAITQPVRVVSSPTPVLVYSDFTSDADDMTALAMLIAEHLAGAISLKAVICTQSTDYSAPFVEAMLSQCGLNGVVQLAAYKGAGRITTDGWEAATCAAFGITKTRLTGGYGDPLTVGRTVLANNMGVQIVEIGPCHETQALMNSPADAISSLTGKQLIAATGKPLALMGGFSADTTDAEFNFGGGAASAADVMANWPVAAGQSASIVIKPFGANAGDQSFNTNVSVPGNPDIWVGRKAVESYAGGGAPYSGCHDPLTVLWAIRGAGSIFAKAVVGGKCSVDASGHATWTGPGTGTHDQLVFAGAGGTARAASGVLAQAAMHKLIAEATMAAGPLA